MYKLFLVSSQESVPALVQAVLVSSLCFAEAALGCCLPFFVPGIFVITGVAAKSTGPAVCSCAAQDLSSFRVAHRCKKRANFLACRKLAVQRLFVPHRCSQLLLGNKFRWGT